MLPARVLAGIRKRGLRATVGLISIRTRAIFDLIAPPTVWGERIGLRSAKSPLGDAELELVFAWSRDAEVLRWSGGAPSQLDFAAFKRALRAERWQPETNQRVFYVVTQAGELIERVGVYAIDWARGEGELGLTLDRQHWDKRYGREATILAVRHLFATTPLKRIYLGTSADNLRAQRAAAASGFRVSGKTRRFMPMLGEYVDGVEMEITPENLR